MDNLNKKPEDDTPGDEIESPVDGPTPDWMRLATSAGSDSSLTEENTPAWLKSIRAGQSLAKDPKSTEAKPATEPPATQGATDDTMSDLERLLAEEGIDLGSVAEERPEGSGDMSARDWLIATSSEEMIRNKLGAEPTEEESAAPQPIAAASDDKMVAEEDLPDWLQEIATDIGETEPDFAFETSTASAPFSEIEDDQIVVEDELPDWLQEIAAESPIAAEPELDLPDFAAPSAIAQVPPAPLDEDKMVVEEDLPDWLQEFSDESLAASEAEPASFDVTPTPPVPVIPASTPPDEDKMVITEELPDWLQEIAAESPIAAEPELDLPDFAAPSAIAQVPPAPLDEDKMVVEEDLPDWLQEFSDESPVVSEAEPASLDVTPTPPVPVIPASTPPDEDKMVITEELPDWLQEIADEPSVAGELELADFAEIPAAPIAPSIPVAEAKIGIEEDLPDWLQEAAAAEALPAVEPELTTPLPTGSSTDKMIVEEDLPDWLREVEVGSTEPSLAFEETDLDMPSTGLDEVDSDEGLPDWLREVEVSSLENNFLMPPLEAPAELPAEPTLTSMGLSSGSEFDSLDDDEDLPDWLKEVQEHDGKGTADAVTPPIPTALDSVSPTTGMIVEEELPDWLREIQEEPEPLALEELETVAKTDQVTHEVIEGEDLPDWLREVEIEEDEPFEPSEPSPEPLTEVVVEETLIIEDELPDWLQEEDEIPEETMADLETPALATATAPASDSAVNLIDEADLPDWLRDVEEEPESLVMAEPIPPPEPVVMASGEPASPLPVPADEADEEVVVVEVAEMSPEPGPLVIETAPAAVSTTSSGIPDWLQKLREVDTEAEQAPTPTPAFATKSVPQPVLAQAITEPEPDLPGDAEERLKLARTARDKGEIDEALRIYDSLISRGVYLDKIIADMQQSVKSHPTNYLVFQVMGDAMMKDGRLQSALNAYREALSRL